MNITDRRTQVAEKDINVVREQAENGGPTTTIGNVNKLGARFLLEQFAREMDCAAGTRRGVGQFAGLLFCQGDKFCQ